MVQFQCRHGVAFPAKMAQFQCHFGGAFTAKMAPFQCQYCGTFTVKMAPFQCHYDDAFTAKMAPFRCRLSGTFAAKMVAHSQSGCFSLIGQFFSRSWGLVTITSTRICSTYAFRVPLCSLSSFSSCKQSPLSFTKSFTSVCSSEFQRSSDPGIFFLRSLTSLYLLIEPQHFK